MTQHETEQLRWTVLQYLAERQRIAFSPEQIRRAIVMQRFLDFAPSVDDVAGVCVFLQGKGYLTFDPDSMGASRYAQATSDGVIAWERRRMETLGA